MQGAYIERVTVDSLINAGPCVLYAVTATMIVAGHTIDIYDGQDKYSGKIVQRLTGLANAPITVTYGTGVYLATGLYIDVGTDGDYVTVTWSTVPEDFVR